MSKRKEIRNILEKLKDSIIQRKDSLNTFQFIRRLLTLKSNITTSILLRKYSYYLPNILHPETNQNAEIILSYNRKISSKKSLKDHVEYCKQNSKIFNISPEIYGKGLFGLSNNLEDSRWELQVLLRNYLKLYNFKFQYSPTLVTKNMLKTTGQLPKFKEQLLRLNERYFLSPTGEVQLGNYRPTDEIRLTTTSRCFRNELNYGKQHRGLIRNLEFEKNEIFLFSKKENSDRHFKMCTRIISNLLRILGFKFRLKRLSADDISFSATRTYDFEIWLPISNFWLEISSISECSDFQTKRSNLKWKGIHPYTINASCLPLGRSIVCLTEYYGDNSVKFLKKINQLLLNINSK